MKILNCLNGMDVGGAETFLVEILRNINKDYKMDIMVRNDGVCRNNNLDKEIRKNSVKIFIAPSFPKHIIQNYKYVNRLLSVEKYDVIHIHANSLIYIIPIIIANKKKIKIVLHSHNSKSLGGILGKILHYINRLLVLNMSINRVACSKVAGQWMFGSKEFTVIDNAVNLDIYRFSLSARMKIREYYNIDDSTRLIGHIGRFVEAKNHIFILKVFEKFCEENNAMLIFLGDGELKGRIQKKVNDKNLNNKVIFVGNTDQVASYLSAMDLMLFPSLYEGLPFALIEAQVSGLPILASDNVSSEAKITECVKFEKLNADVKVWCNEMENLLKNSIDRSSYYKNIQGTKYDSQNMFEQLIEVYGR